MVKKKLCNHSNMTIIDITFSQRVYTLFRSQVLKYIDGQHKIISRHVKWVKFLQSFTFFIKHKSRVCNQVVDTLSCKHSLLSKSQVKVKLLRFLRNSTQMIPILVKQKCFSYSLPHFFLYKMVIFSKIKDYEFLNVHQQHPLSLNLMEHDFSWTLWEG